MTINRFLAVITERMAKEWGNTGVAGVASGEQNFLWKINLPKLTFTSERRIILACYAK